MVVAGRLRPSACAIAVVKETLAQNPFHPTRQAQMTAPSELQPSRPQVFGSLYYHEVETEPIPPHDPKLLLSHDPFVLMGETLDWNLLVVAVETA